MLKIVNTFLLSVGIWMMISCPAAAGVSDRYGTYFVTVEWLEQHLDNDGITIIDARGEKAYKKGHIPGALPVSWKQLSDMSPEFCARNWGTVTDKALLSNVISGLGIEKDTPIVIYADTRNGWGEDGRVFWTFRIAGLENLKILDGGIGHWKEQTGRISKTGPDVVKSGFKAAHLNLDAAIDTDALMSGYAGFKVVDTREKDEFKGAVKYGEKRGGHLPGAVLLSYTDFLDNGLLKPVGELEKMVTGKGIQTGDRVVAYCTAGIRSAYVQVILEMLGYASAVNYDESFYVWGNEADTPMGKVVKDKAYNFITAEQLNRKVIANAPVTIVDIQPHKDFQKHHISGAIETAAYPVKSDAEKQRLAALVPQLGKTSGDIVVVCPRGGGGAHRTVAYLTGAGISPSRLLILENGQAGWPY